MPQTSLITGISLVKHGTGAPGLRWLGLGPGLTPSFGLKQLEIFLKKHAAWATKRKKRDLKQMLANSSVVISLWKNKKLVGFGRATSDKTYRAVLWDVVVSDELQGLGLGKILVNALLEAPEISNVEKIYLMTSNSKEFYEQCGFIKVDRQVLMIKTLESSS